MVDIKQLSLYLVCYLKCYLEKTFFLRLECKHLPVSTGICIFQEYEEPVYSYSTYPVRRSPRDIHNILKMSPPFASSEGVSVSGDRYQSDDARRTQPPRHCLSSRCRNRTCCSFALTFSFSFCFFLHYLSLFSFSFHPKSDISAL